MRFKLSYKIFATLTLTSLLVVVLMVGLIRFYVARNFADYANKSQLEKYTDVAAALAAEYQAHQGWQRLKDNPRRWDKILRASLPRKDDKPPRRPRRPPDFENKRTRNGANPGTIRAHAPAMDFRYRP